MEIVLCLVSLNNTSSTQKTSIFNFLTSKSLHLQLTIPATSPTCDIIIHASNDKLYRIQNKQAHNINKHKSITVNSMKEQSKSQEKRVITVLVVPLKKHNINKHKTKSTLRVDVSFLTLIPHPLSLHYWIHVLQPLIYTDFMHATIVLDSCEYSIFLCSFI